ncbi:MAG TPA: sirohydrochlorin chelatase, partial [Polyangiaceae bacterium]|nr:sirohydrochlorin chelatase [Polyangiaceae bacterium]
MLDDGVLLIGHGSREPGANAEFEALAADYRARHPEWCVETAYIELAAPLVQDALTQLAGRVRRLTVVPVFLFAAGHVKNDLPLALERARLAFPGTRFVVSPALGVHPRLAELAFRRVDEAMQSCGARPESTLLLVVGRGASDPDANGDFYKMARLIAEGRGLLHVEAAFMGITQPSVPRALEWIARLRPPRLLVLPYLLFGGRLVTKLAQQIDEFCARHPWIVGSMASYLGQHELLLDLIEERVSQARAGAVLLPCDNCQYRVGLPGRASEVGGLRALLYSVRHSLTHSDVQAPEHRHRPLRKHVLVCGNADCVDRGSIVLLETLRRELKQLGRARDIL